METSISDYGDVTGQFVTLADERYYAIGNVDQMPPFFISMVSDSDHWMFIASNGGLTAGRVSPDTALFPYITVDNLYESSLHTGSKTLLQVTLQDVQYDWEPFNREHDGRYTVSRNLYKNVLGNKLLFEEINHDLKLAFRYRWLSSHEYGFVRQCEVENRGEKICQLDLVDGLQNILPAGTPRFTQTNTSYLVDAYKWNELDEHTGLAFYTLFSAITDRAEPCESLKATTVFCHGLEDSKVLLSSRQLDNFRRGDAITQEKHTRGIRGAYFVNASTELAPQSFRRWQLVANLEQSQTQSAHLLHHLRSPGSVAEDVARSVDRGSDALARILGAGDGFQVAAEENVSTHHYANVLFNILRGGIFNNQYLVASRHFIDHIKLFNRPVYARHRMMLDSMPEQLDCAELGLLLRQQSDAQLERLGYEYLPITFGRRHGDPSRPWNQFSINLLNEKGDALLSYQGNWRDIFQNWEALLFSYPEFIENVIAKFVNASTVDGYNPYRISNEGIDWEVEEPDDPWSYIGYWGDHQIIYLQKLLELSRQFHPSRLSDMLLQATFSYANVPYRIKPIEEQLRNAKSTVIYDEEEAQRIEQRVADLGADGRLLLDSEGQVYQVTLLEKLLVPLLSKLGNLVIDGGIWLNTQRPEWNDANNALVGQGLSMVTLYYLRRYINFMSQLLEDVPNTVSLSAEVSHWLMETSEALSGVRVRLGDKPLDAGLRYRSLLELGEASSRYRQRVYRSRSLSGPVAQDLAPLTAMLDDALAAIDQSISSNRREDGLYHAYNLMSQQETTLEVEHLYPMLEGQVAVLASGTIASVEAIRLLEALFQSDLFRKDQNSFLLYPDRDLPGFLQKNQVPASRVHALPLLVRMLEEEDHRIIEHDAGGIYRFNADLTNVDALNRKLDRLAPEYGETVDVARHSLQELYEQVFNHRAFTGRSGGMFGFEGLGSIYWHMVSKLLLAVQECFFNAVEQGADADTCRQLGDFYYRVRGGIGFNKTPEEYGAFPTDPYSHTPQHAGAQQPGMTGQVKEEILTRFGELGIRVSGGAVRFYPGLLRPCEFLTNARPFRFLAVDGKWRELIVPGSGLGFTWCQVPLVYSLDEQTEPAVTVVWESGRRQTLPGLELPVEVAGEVFRRSGRISQLELVLAPGQLFAG